MTNDELQAIRARCEAATPGPWQNLLPSVGIDKNNHVTDSVDSMVVHCFGFNHSVDEVSKRNATFIAASRTDVPDLLAHIDEQVVPLTWTTEPPKESGHYWCRYKGSNKATWSPAYIPAVDDLRSYGMQTDERIEWAGPIPMPKEPTI